MLATKPDAPIPLTGSAGNRRIRYALTHLVASAVVVSLFVAWVITVWYPPPLHILQGVLSILLILAAVDVCLGPLATFIVAAPRKPRKELRRDLSAIVCVQMLALLYGTWTVFSARPAYIVFNADRFDVVPATEVLLEYRGKTAENEFAGLSVVGPRFVFAQQPASTDERRDILFSAATGGADIKNYPHLFRAWPGDSSIVRNRVRPISELAGIGDAHRAAVDRAVARSGKAAVDLGWLAVVGRVRDGVVLVDKNDLAIVDTLPISPE